mgnify:FL=1|jgi:hypothetical protein|tara:strand:+ start:71 stop:604 length:534 start_codon:yes stop_codon:yes gene_type:complete
MTDCTICKKDLANERIHLGYTECLDCSKVDKYSSHTVYPHKTGGFIQPMSVEQSDNLKRLDRRSSGGSARKAKGIVSDNSWDRWLEEYLKPKEDKPKFTPKPTPLPIYIPIREAMKEVIDKYENRGYDSACELTQSLYSKDKISLMDRSQIINELTGLQMLTSKQRNGIKKLGEYNG